MHVRSKGFTLIELMIVVGIIGIILAVAIPGYNKQVRHSRRSEAQQILGDCAMKQERYRADNPTYGTDAQAGCTTSNTWYNFATTGNTATAYTISATAIVAKDQNNDSQEGTPCRVLKIIKNTTDTKLVKTSGAATTENLTCWK